MRRHSPLSLARADGRAWASYAEEYGPSALS
uniref:Uncharacterized protein n=1 Tax=Arundo donax TaxID=35708 RepID=A0A0A9HII9_ARUDO